MSTVPASADENPVVIYDVMREAATRLRGALVARGEIEAARAVHDKVRAVDPRDMAAQRAKTAELHERFLAMLDD